MDWKVGHYFGRLVHQIRLIWITLHEDVKSNAYAIKHPSLKDLIVR